MAAVVALDIALPSVGAVLKPQVTEGIFVLLFLAFLRIEGSAVVAHLRRPRQLIASTV